MDSELFLSTAQRTALEILEETARNRTTITYGELGAAINVIPVRVGKFLFELQQELNRAGYPPLNHLVVNKKSNIPGYNVNAPHGHKPIDTLKAREEVYQYFAKNP